MVSGFERNWICAPKLCCSICLHFKDRSWLGTAYLCLSWCTLNWEYTENRTAGHPIKKFSHFHLLLFWLHIIICPQDAALLRNRNFKALITFLLLFLEMNSFLSHVFVLLLICLNTVMSKFNFVFKNYKFLKSLKNGQFLFLCQNWR